MARKQKVKKSNRKAGRRSTATKKPQPAVDSMTRILNAAAAEACPNVALEIFEEVLELCRANADDYVFDSESQDAWTTPSARKYLQALYGVGTSLWRVGDTLAAIKRFQELLDADPQDHLLARYWLAASLIAKRQFDEAAALLERWDDQTDVWVYAKALARFALDGDSDDARALLQSAGQLDNRFLDYLLGDQIVKADTPIGFQSGRRNTHSCARLLLPAWRVVPGAQTWARQVLRVPIASRDDSVSFPREQLLALPHARCDWQVGLRCLDSGQPADQANWIFAVVDVVAQQVRGGGVIEGPPTPQAVWRQALNAFLQPMDGKPSRPMCLEVPRPEFRREWREMLKEIDVDCVVNYNTGLLDRLLEGLEGMFVNGMGSELPEVPEDFDPREFPLGDQTWQVDFFHQPFIISNNQVGVQRPWSIVVVDKKVGSVVSQELISGEPSPDQLWSNVAALMLKHSTRPKRIEVADSDGYDSLRPYLTNAGVECVLLDELPELHEFCVRMSASVDDSGKSALADGDGVTDEVMEDFYYAAASYFRQAPWEYMPGEIPIEIQISGLGTRYGIVLGRTGVTLGLVLFETWQSAADLANGRRTITDLNALAVIFDEESILAASDIYRQERNGWPIATPEAYPAAMRFRPGYEPGSPSLRDVQILNACLTGLPGFLTGQVSTTLGADEPLECRWCPSRPVPRTTGSVRHADSVGRSAAVSVMSAVTHTNRKRETYYLHEGRTKTGKPKYHFSKKSEGEVCTAMPDGFEVYENPRGQVYCRLIKPKLFADSEVEAVREAIDRAGKKFLAQVDVKGKDIIVYEDESPVFKFTLCDKDKRLFRASRWCFRGSIDDWIELFANPQTLPHLAAKYCRHIGEESFFELM